MSALDVFEQMPDTDVMLRVQWGSERAFAELYRRYYRRLQDFFYGLGRDAHMAEDLCHETFMRLWKLRARYKATGNFAAYVFTVARHIWQERCRKARKDWRLGIQRSVENEGALALVARTPAPDESAHRSEVDERIFAVLDTLPEEQRMAFVLRTVEGMALEDIARVMECPVNTVRSRRLLAIKQLRKALRGLFVL